MSKKNKAKFKKQIKNQIIEQITKTDTNPVNKINIQESNLKITKDETTVKPEMQNLAQIKADLAKTGYVVAGLAICLTALFLLNQKYNTLSTFGNWVVKILHIQ
jgi:hypothetical protein